MAEYILTQLQWWVAYLCCASHYTYAEWCTAPWLIDKVDRDAMKQDRNSLRDLVYFIQKYRKENKQ